MAAAQQLCAGGGGSGSCSRCSSGGGAGGVAQNKDSCNPPQRLCTLVRGSGCGWEGKTRAPGDMLGNSGEALFPSCDPS